MNVQRKDASIQNTSDDFPGSFEVVLSAPTKDRDGETLQPDEWKQPLPDHITFDADHGMSVASTVGSGAPRIDPLTGNLVVSGTYSSLPRAQEVRTLVNEGHIRTTSVAFMTEPSEVKDGKPGPKVRELLNGAFVAIPSNREAVVLASKSVPSPRDVFGKAGARNSTSDTALIQQAHDATAALGAMCAPGDVYDGPASKAHTKDGTPAELAQGTDAALDQALALLEGVDLSTLPEPVAQAIALLQAADASSDDLLDAMGVDDPDDEESDSEESAAKAAGLEDIELKYRALSIIASVG